jgi:AAA domain-containing protein
VNATFEEALARQDPLQRGKNIVARCPAHEDRVRSLSVTDFGDKVGVKCHAGCDINDIVAELGIRMTDLFEDSANAPAPTRVAQYDYRDEAGIVLYRAVRYEPKTFSLELPDGTRHLNGVRRVPYRLPELLASDKTVVVVEGEKDADRLASLGFIATTNAGGAGAWQSAWADFFKNRVVRVLPDNDAPGAKYAQAVADSLKDVADVKIIDLPDLPPKGDVSDWLDAGHTVDELKLVLRRKPDHRKRLSYERMSDIEVIESSGLQFSPFVLSEGPTILFGDGGSGKSTLALCVAASMATGREIIPDLAPVDIGPVLWIDYEAQRLTTKKRANRLGVADAPIIYVPGKRPLVDDVDRLKRIAEVEGAKTAILDSIVLSSGGKSPNDAEAATAWANAMNEIVPRSVALAHVTKSSEDTGRYPYGSIFWHNVARLTWYVKRDHDAEGHAIELFCRKRNDGDKFPPMKLEFDWRTGLRVLSMSEMTLADRIADALAGGPFTVSEIAAAIERSPETVRKTLDRNRGRFVYMPGVGPGEPGRWSMFGPNGY